MSPVPPRSTPTDTLLPYTALFRSCVHHGGGGRSDELRAVLGGPVAAGLCRDRGLLELREHVAAHQLVAAPHGGAVGPPLGHGQERAEPAGLVDEPLDLGLGVVDRAATRDARRVHGVGPTAGGAGLDATRLEQERGG